MTHKKASWNSFYCQSIVCIIQIILLYVLYDLQLNCIFLLVSFFSLPFFLLFFVIWINTRVTGVASSFIYYSSLGIQGQRSFGQVLWCWRLPSSLLSSTPCNLGDLECSLSYLSWLNQPSDKCWGIEETLHHKEKKSHKTLLVIVYKRKWSTWNDSKTLL